MTISIGQVAGNLAMTSIIQWARGGLARAALFMGLVLASALAPAQTVTYFHNDASGTPVLATDAGGNVVWKENYLPYGDRVNNASAGGGNSIGFAGKPFDATTGLSYMGARYYDPGIGRFMGVDAAPADPGSGHGFNRYAYANNNPYKYVDPDGHSPIDVAFLVFDLGKLGHAIYKGDGVGHAMVDVAMSAVGVVSPIPGVGQVMKGTRTIERGVEAARAAEHGIEAAKGIAADAQFAQKTYGTMFSNGGTFAGKSVDEVAAALRSGAMKPSEVPIDYIVRDGKTVILNTRSSQALDATGVARSEWNAVNRTGNAAYEGRLSDQLTRNPGGPFDTVRRSGGN